MTGCGKDGIAVSEMTVHARLRPKLTTTVRAFEAQGNRQLFPATRNPSARTPAHAVIVPIHHQSLALIVTRRRTRFDGQQAAPPPVPAPLPGSGDDQPGGGAAKGADLSPAAAPAAADRAGCLTGGWKADAPGSTPRPPAAGQLVVRCCRLPH